jgi:S-layer protein
VDTWNGGTGNDAFNATGESFLSGLDNLNCGDGTDTLNVTNTGAASVVTSWATAAAKTVLLAGDKALTLTDSVWKAATALTVSNTALTTFTNAPTTTVTVTGAGGLSANLSTQTALTAIDAPDSSGANTVSVDGTKSAYTGGSGVDIVTLTNATGFETLGAGAAPSRPLESRRTYASCRGWETEQP